MENQIDNRAILAAGRKVWIAMAPNGPHVRRFAGKGWHVSEVDLPFAPFGEQDIGIVVIEDETRAGDVVNALLAAWEWPIVLFPMPSVMEGIAGLVASGSDALHAVALIRDEGLEVVTKGLDLTAATVPLVPYIAIGVAILGALWLVLGLVRST